ncbi:MAG: Spx/MgsR family RNA polymerase-binding regulatory protein [Pseudomonadota bacterium]
MITVHGISNCDTVKKSLKWLDNNNVRYQFRDVRKDPITAHEVEQWLQQVPAEQLVNKRSTSWRQLTEQQKQLADNTAVAKLIAEQPTLFKRPLVQDEHDMHVGFNDASWQQRYL